MYISHSVIVLILVLFSVNNYAGESDGSLYGSRWINIEHKDGLVSQLPTTTPLELLHQVRTLRNKLVARQFELDKTLEESEFDATNTLITLIMPGGLVYGAYRKLQHKQAESQLKSVTSEITQLSRDLEMLKLATSEYTVSMLYQP
jgi:hypothetical protein